TGTAENVHGKVGSGTEGYHGWFVGFAPYENPEIAIVVLMENGGEGSDVAAPMSALVMNYYFNFVRNKKSFDPKEKDRKETPKNTTAPQAAVVEVHGTTN
ncbi:MAG TPA: penicillin-binding transpeptidase domain-containing protein, partial [bacterium]|nr:penicillin-binding transpeptidase domain-containing protein [bacterium]